MITTTYTVKGMTCGHCVRSVTEELTEIDAVHKVEVDLATGTVTVTSDSEVPVDDIRTAIDEAGYDLVDA